MTDGSVDVRKGVIYATHDGVELAGDLYLPKSGAKAAPAIVAIHGGAWVGGSRAAYQNWGHYLAARGTAVFAVSYRLAKPNQKTFPHAVHDVLAGIQFVRGKAGGFNIDPERIGVLGSSAGGHLAALAALGGDARIFANAYPQDEHASVSPKVKVLVGVYGIYDALAMWSSYLLDGPRGNNVETMIGMPPMENRQVYFDATPINYATFAKNKLPVLLVTGTEDDIVPPRLHFEPFLLALKQANFFVRTCIVPGAPHFWMNDPIEEPTSHSGFLAPRLTRFLTERL
jgi:acetyl esterase/lipase